MSIGNVNYATEYSRALSQVFPYVLNFGALYNTANNGKYRWVNAKTIEIPSISTTGRIDASRDTIGNAARNYDNAWETKTLTNQRKWSTLVHPMDVDQTNMVTTISNITKVFNEEQKFPEMDAYTVSKIYYDWVQNGGVADTTALTTSNVLSVFDDLMLKMDNERVPANGRILYVTHEVKSMLKNAQGINREFYVQTGNATVKRAVDRLEEVEVIGVPAQLMKTEYVFTTGWAPASTADQINMFLVHPVAVITPVSYTFSKLDAPSAVTEGKYYYYEEAFEDAFILNKKAAAIQYNITPKADLTVTSVAGTSTGTTKITVSPAKATGNSYVYEVGDSVTAPAQGADCSAMTDWNGTADITAATGKKILIVEVDSDDKCQKYGIATVTAKA